MQPKTLRIPSLLTPAQSTSIRAPTPPGARARGTVNFVNFRGRSAEVFTPSLFTPPQVTPCYATAISET
jgi:hypothetical protein